MNMEAKQEDSVLWN